MCWNKEVSISTFALISVICYGLYKRNLPNDRVMAIFVMAYGAMQLCETIIWVGLEYNKPIINKIGTVLAILLLYFHPLGLMLGIKYDNFYNNIKKKPLYKLFLGLAVFLFVLGVINIIYQGLVNKHNYISYVSPKSPHLIWKIPKYLDKQYKYGVILFVIVLFSIMCPKNMVYSLFILAFFVLTAIYSLNVGPKGLEFEIFRSYWCWLVAILAFLIYFVTPFFQKYNIEN
mgnify:CR=1 FL=1